MKASPVLDRLMRPALRMMQPPPGMAFDFSAPKGEPALVEPDSVSWRVFKNPVTLFVGGVAAVILELAEPSVRAGVWDHSAFRENAPLRLQRTGMAAMMTVYGPHSQAQGMIERVVRMHDRVAGVTSKGVPYHANDPRLLDWVQATASYGFIEAYSRFASPLSLREQSQGFAETATAAALYGATGAPTSVEAWRRMLEAAAPRLERSDILFEFLSIMRTASLVPRQLRPMQRLLVDAAIDVVPEAVRVRLGLPASRLSTPKRALVSLAAQVADRTPIGDAPPAQASLRVGRDAAFLYR